MKNLSFKKIMTRAIATSLVLFVICIIAMLASTFYGRAQAAAEAKKNINNIDNIDASTLVLLQAGENKEIKWIPLIKVNNKGVEATIFIEATSIIRDKESQKVGYYQLTHFMNRPLNVLTTRVADCSAKTITITNALFIVDGQALENDQFKTPVVIDANKEDTPVGFELKTMCDTLEW